MTDETTTELKGSLNELMGNVKTMFSSKDKDGKQGERQQFILAQLGELNNKIADLENTVSVGVPLTEATETIQKLNSVQKGLEMTETKLTDYLSRIEELKTQSEGLEKSLAAKMSKSQFDSIVSRINSLEELYKDLSVSQTKDTFMSLLDIMDKIDARVKALETALGEGLIDPDGPMDSEKSGGVEKPSEPVMEKPPKKKGFLNGVFSAIGGFFGR